MSLFGHQNTAAGWPAFGIGNNNNKMTSGATTNTNFSGLGNNNTSQSSPAKSDNYNSNLGYATNNPFVASPPANNPFLPPGSGWPTFNPNNKSWGKGSGATGTAAGTFSDWSTKQSTVGSSVMVPNPFVAKSASTNSNSTGLIGCSVPQNNAHLQPQQATGTAKPALAWPAKSDEPRGPANDQNSSNHGVPKKIFNYTKKMSWQFPLDEQQLEALVHIGVDVMNVASKGLAATTTLPAPLVTRLMTAFSESHEIFRFINDQWMALTGSPHAICLYNMACLLSLLVELELRFLEDSNKESKEIGRGLLAIAKAYESVPICDQRSVIPIMPGGAAAGMARIGSKEATIGQMIFKQLKASKACLGASISVGWSDIKHLQTDPDLRALRELLPDKTNTRSTN